jgi:hypothetical protein
MLLEAVLSQHTIQMNKKMVFFADECIIWKLFALTVLHFYSEYGGVWFFQDIC